MLQYVNYIYRVYKGMLGITTVTLFLSSDSCGELTRVEKQKGREGEGEEVEESDPKLLNA